MGDSVIDTGLPTQSGDTQDDNRAEFYESVKDEAVPAADEIAIEKQQDANGELFANRIRQRAEETNRGDYKVLPKFNYTYRDCNEFKYELNEWFDFYGFEDKQGTSLYEAKRVFNLGFPSKKTQQRAWNESSQQVKSDFIRQHVTRIKDDQWGKDERLESILCIYYIALGSFGEVRTVKDHEREIVDNCRLLWREEGCLEVVFNRCKQLCDVKCPVDMTASLDPDLDIDSLDTELDLLLTVLYVSIESLRDDEEFIKLINRMDVLGYFTEAIGRLRWTVVGKLPTKLLLLLIWKCIMCVFGGSTKLAQVKSHVRKSMGLSEQKSEEEEKEDNVINASPIDYHAFRQDLISRYPSYIPPPSVVPQTLENNSSITHYIEVARPNHMHTQNASLPVPTAHIATPAPSPPSSPAIAAGQKVRKSVFMTNQSFPFLYPTDDQVPESIVEAGELFSSRVKMKPASVQMWNVRDQFMQKERGWVAGDDDESAESDRETNGTSAKSIEQEVLDRVEGYYQQHHQKLNSFVMVLLNLFLKSISFANADDNVHVSRTKEITLNAISSILILLIKWLKVSHVLKFEYLASIIFDSRYYLVVYKLLYSHHVLERALNVPDVASLAFFSQARSLSDFATGDYYGDTAIEEVASPPPYEAQFVDSFDTFSERYLHTMVNLTKVLRKVVKNKTRRVIVVAELPMATLRKALSIYQRDLWCTVLNIFKEQVPFNGRKWKYNNMDLVSAIYLNCKSKLRDDWLVGVDVTAEVDDAYSQEVALRALTQFYNDQMYGDAKDQADFFAHELDVLSLNNL